MIDHIFLDLDGVLADFDQGCLTITGKTPEQWSNYSKGALWRALGDLHHFYGTLPVHPFAHILLDHIHLEVQDKWPGLTYSVLSALPISNRDAALSGKTLWLQTNFPFLEYRLTPDTTKTSHGQPNTVLVDDRLKIAMAWHNANLPVIHFDGDAAATLRRLDDLLAHHNQPKD